MKTRQLLTLLAIATVSTGFSFAAEPDKDAKPEGVPASYPLKTCPVSGEKLGEMGKPHKVSHDGTDVYLCCKKCTKEFDKDPAKFTKAVKDALTKK
jgi:YHS domain-containing protein